MQINNRVIHSAGTALVAVFLGNNDRRDATNGHADSRANGGGNGDHQGGDDQVLQR